MEYSDDPGQDNSLVGIVLFLLIALVICAPAGQTKASAGTTSAGCKASEIDHTLFVESIIGEAEGEEYVGKLAVACAIRNRGTLDGVYGWRAPRVRLHAYSSRVFVQAVRAYEESAQPVNCQFIDGATHWQSKADRKKAGKWLRAYEVVAKIGGHWFYVKK